MKKYLSLLTLALFLLPASGFCIANYKVGDQLNVLAPSGLILREAPKAKGKKLTTVAPGEMVTVLQANFKKFSHAVTEFKGYNIRGFWVKVRTSGGQEGYVFDGYLSRYKAPGTFAIQEEEGSLTTPEQYLAAHSEQRGARIEIPKTPNRYERYKQIYQNGAEVEVNIGEGGALYTMTFDQGLTFEEGYLIGRLIWMEGPVKSRIEGGKVTLLNQAETQEVVVKKQGGRIIVTLGIAD